MSPADITALSILLTAASVNLASAQESWTEVGALFNDRCVMCHSGESAPSGLKLDTYEDALKGSRRGPVLVSDDPPASELLLRVKGESQPAMPLVGEALSQDEIALLERWVENGVPRGEPPAADADAGGTSTMSETVTFVDVEPIFLQHCVLCHSDGGKLGAPPEGLRLDTYANIIRGGERLAVMPGQPTASEVIRRVEGVARPRMPLDGPPLPEDEVALLRRWIAEGAADADGAGAPVPADGAVRYRGVLTGRWSIDGVPFAVDGGTRIDNAPAIGQPAEMRGVVNWNGGLRATRLRTR